MPETMTLSEIDHPPRWLGRDCLQITASGCRLDDVAPGELDVWLDEEKLVELIQAWMHDPHDEFEGVLLRADLAEAVGDKLILRGSTPAALLDWARHFEMLAARRRAAAR